MSKAHADVVLISGHDGGTGASPLTSLKHAGAPWELGLAETQQTLLLNGLRDRIVVQVDGQLKTGRDVVIAALLGAEEFGFATAPLVVCGCVMMRVCHLDTCPVGVATQNPELRKQFTGKPEFVVNFFEFIAEEVREHLAALGLPLDRRGDRPRRGARHPRGASTTGRRTGLDLSPILARARATRTSQTLLLHRRRRTTASTGRSTSSSSQQAAAGARARARRCTIELPIRNVNRTVGTMLGSRAHQALRRRRACPTTRSTSRFTRLGRPELRRVRAARASRCGSRATPTTTSARACRAAASSCARDRDAPFVAEENIIAGNVILYGATGGEVFLRGVVGERFCVRNSGATAVVEGVGDHGCEYMTGGRVVVLGPTGRNFGAGHVGRHRLRLRPRRHVRRAASTARWSTSTRSTTTTSSGCATTIERHRELTGSAVAERDCSADWDERGRRSSARSCRRTTSGCSTVMREAERDGLSTSETMAKVMEAAHG